MAHLLLYGQRAVQGHEPLILIYSSASHSFVSEPLVTKFALPMKPGVDMKVAFVDGSQVQVSSVYHML